MNDKTEADGAKKPDRKYDKGEGRTKHVGNKPLPYFKRIGDSPKHYIGICPNNVSDEVKSKLLNDAVTAKNGDREIAVPKRLYNVHLGAIYEAQTSDGGTSYHAYPYRGTLPRHLIAKLLDKAIEEKSETEFKAWCKSYILESGR